MKVGILGSGDVGRSLGAGLLSLGHEVRIGTRKPGSKKVRDWVGSQGQRASAGTFAEAAGFADLAFLATRWTGTRSAIQLAGPDRLAGKVVVDVTNPLKVPAGGAPRLAVGHRESAGERVQSWLPRSRVVKAFNTVGHAHMFHPAFSGGPPTMFVCGNDADAKKTVGEIVSAFGWMPIDIGGIEAARLLEPMAMLWITYGIRTGTWSHAFTLLRK